MSSLPTPPTDWLVTNGYLRNEYDNIPWGPREREAALRYAYEQQQGHPPPPDFEPGTKAWEQFVYRGKRDATEVAA